MATARYYSFLGSFKKAAQVTAGAGAATGVGTVAAVGAIVLAADGALTGTGTVNAQGRAFIPADGQAAGSAIQVGIGTSIYHLQSAATGTGTAAATGFELIRISPDADVSDGNWTNQAGSNVNLFASIDELTASDSDYIQSQTNPQNDLAEVSLVDPPFQLASPIVARYRYKKEGTSQVDLIVRLMQGATQIAQWSHSDISESYVDAAQTLTTPQVAAITDPNDLRFQFEADSP